MLNNNININNFICLNIESNPFVPLHSSKTSFPLVLFDEQQTQARNGVASPLVPALLLVNVF